MAREARDLEAALHDQTNLLPFKDLMKVFFTMAFSSMVCFIDQNGIGVLLPSIADDLHAANTIAWAGTSALIANTVFQVLYGRLSDLFGRKKIMISALILLSISDLICGLAPNATVLYVFRGMAGIANGGLVSLTNMVVSDVVTLQERGKYQGILGSTIGIGNAAGPLIAAAFVENATWRGLFYLLAPLALISAALSSWVLPSNMPEVNFKETIQKLDFLGLFLGTVAIIFILIPVSEGGHEKSWDSPQIITMLIIGGVCAFLFVLVEWKFAKLPMMPMKIFRIPSVAAMLLQSFLMGVCYYSYIYYLPLYYQNVRGYTPLMSAVLILPLVLPQAVFSAIGGQYISRMNRYGEIIWTGFGVWTLGAGLLTTCNRTTSAGKISAFCILVGMGVGFTFQPTITALQAHCPKAHRAIIISNRNLLRSLGGAVGLAVSSALLGNVLRSNLPPHLQYIARSTFAVPDLNTVSSADRISIETAYAKASRAVFVFCTPVIACAFLATVFVKDIGVEREEEVAAEQQNQMTQQGEQSGQDAKTTESEIVALANAQEEYTKMDNLGSAVPCTETEQGSSQSKHDSSMSGASPLQQH